MFLFFTALTGLKSPLGLNGEKYDQGERDGCWEGAFLPPITPSAPFRHASRVPSSSCDPNREDWGRVSSRFCNFHRNLKRKILLIEGRRIFIITVQPYN